MNKNLWVTLVQSNLVWEDVPANIRAFQKKLSRIEKGQTDLIILPEMFSTGFSMRPDLFAEKMEGSTMQWMSWMAEKTKSVIAGSMMIKDGKRFYNRFIWMQPDGNYSFYDKRHLFRMGNEGETYSSGKEKVIVEWKGWKVCLQICYDLRFPVFSRNSISQKGKSFNYEYDLLVYVANWPSVRHHVWQQLLAARAMENQCYVVGVNRTGKDGNGIQHAGGSCVIDPLGHSLFNAGALQKIHSESLDKKGLAELRTKFPVLLDADKFLLK